MFYKKFSEIKVGVFVFIAIIIVTATVFWAKGFIVGKDKMNLTCYFKTIPSLNQGDPVSVNGVVKGKVSAIELEGDSVKVFFNLEKDVRIKKDYTIQITSPELMAGKTLFIKPGKETEEIDYTKPLYGSKGSDMSSIMESVSDMSGDIKTLIGKFNNTTDDLSAVLKNINDIVGDPRMTNDLKGTISNLSVTSRNLNGLVSESRTNIKGLTDKADKTMTSVNTMIDENSPEMKKTFQEIQALTTRFDSLVLNLNLIVSDIQTKKSGVGKFIYDDRFFENLNRTIEELEKLTKNIREEGIKINLF
ncbi:MAG: MlaD family protein [Ignavibacteria bacterium]|nr:MlaD family protein [Ignavibacteria bacterium]